MEQLWEQFQLETRAGYDLYRKEIARDGLAKQGGLGRGMRIPRALFWAILMKLSPARRLVLLLALAMGVLGSLQGSSGAGLFGVDLRAWAILLLLVLLALELADRVTMKRDLEIAREIQRWLVPQVPPRIPGVDVAFTTRPANTVAGDYHDAFFRDADGTSLLLVVADVAGKGVPAALLMATFQACLHSWARESRDLVFLAERLNRFASTRSLDGARFTTAFLAELSLHGHAMRYINAGHNAPVLRRAAGACERLERGGIPFGIDAEARFDLGETRLATGDLLFVFSDGLVEAVNRADEDFGDARMLETLGALGGETASGTIRRLLERVELFTAGTRQGDDITCLALRME